MDYVISLKVRGFALVAFKLVGDLLGVVISFVLC